MSGRVAASARGPGGQPTDPGPGLVDAGDNPRLASGAEPDAAHSGTQAATRSTAGRATS